MAERKRLYRVWKGSNKFLCGGRLIFGPDAGSLFLSTILITSPLVGLCFQCITKLNSETPEKQVLGLPVLVVTVLLGLANFSFLLLTSSRDPGIVPRNARPPEPSVDDDAAATPSTEWVMMHAANQHLRLPRTRDVVVGGGGHVVRVKYCDTCLLYRPPRASHCSICNNCVLKFDHHCPWVGQCIGLRNYRFFFLFIATSTFLCVYVFALSWLNIAAQRDGSSLVRCMTGEPLSLVLIVYTFVAAWFVGGLTVFHVYLMSTNQTTYENFRYRYDNKENPYDRGVLANISEVFCTRIPPSMNHFREWVEISDEPCDDDDRPLSSRNKIDLVGTNDDEKIDLEMAVFNTGVPAILQGIWIGIGMGYSEMQRNDVSVHVKDRDVAEAPDPLMIPAVREQDERHIGP
ncbi:hypothetical protein PR202_ga24036 [Eleusine coracana subsp. coracana]|uniref:S-acyltransferase n=1 Tax=Eleusine coracana subsp. coracana TaxID=191504 RepID=A0AAV5D7C0_ELECO|nr:hypothetical protein PR202_ga24036 [Eleusine coracana subsp. coracana]